MQRKPQKILFPTITTTKTRKDKVLSIPKDMHIYYERFVLFHCLIFITIFFQRIKPRITNVSISYYRIEIRGKLLYDKIMAKSFTSLFIQFHLMCLLASRERRNKKCLLILCCCPRVQWNSFYLSRNLCILDFKKKKLL